MARKARSETPLALDDDHHEALAMTRQSQHSLREVHFEQLTMQQQDLWTGQPHSVHHQQDTVPDQETLDLRHQQALVAIQALEQERIQPVNREQSK